MTVRDKDRDMDGIRNSKENLIGVSDGDSDSDIV